MVRFISSSLALGALLTLGGCASIVAEGGSAGAGIVSGSLASALTDSAGAAAGIGIGVQAATRSGIAAGQRKIHGNAQQNIADVAGPMPVGQVERWRVDHPIPLEPSQSGRVTVSRVISSGLLECKEIVFSVDASSGKDLPSASFYVASICRNGTAWAWASAEPATARWGSLQ
jgi:hypothetical protein